ncbi:MAG: triose-phosphate isomerase [Candidatus Auribacterota bacterium]|jgi:triosephosphate isomerase|nr:triose-phosphate isomerase [Candidatus Auribacterota bacterium]
MRRPILAGNWKMNTSLKEAVELVTGLKRELAGVTDADIVVCPPFTHLTTIRDVVAGSNIALGAQNMYIAEEGAFTGEISPKMLKDSGCTYVILGHSERRQYFNESDEFINTKAKKALEHGLTPIICVGETLDQREQGITGKIVTTQIKGCLAGLSESDMLKCVIAYEPVWAIGTGKTASNAQAQEVHALIRSLLTELFSETVAQKIRIQYGGSVKPDNIAGLMQEKDIDGALVGGASLKVSSFAGIVLFNK